MAWRRLRANRLAYGGGVVLVSGLWEPGHAGAGTGVDTWTGLPRCESCGGAVAWGPRAWLGGATGAPPRPRMPSILSLKRGGGGGGVPLVNTWRAGPEAGGRATGS